MRRTYQFFGAVALVGAIGLLAGCSDLRRLSKNDSRAALHLPGRHSQEIEAAKNAQAAQMYADEQICYTAQDGTTHVYIPRENVVVDSLSQVSMWTFDIDAVTVSARSSRNLVERQGKIAFKFIVSVPDTLLDSNWQLVLNPWVREGDNPDALPLDPLVYRGRKFVRMQDGEYARYDRARDGMVRDLRRYVRTTDDFVTRHSTYVPDDRQPLDHLTDYLTPRYRYDSIDVLPGGRYYTRVDGEYPEEGGREREAYIRSLAETSGRGETDVRRAGTSAVRDMAGKRLDWTNRKRGQIAPLLYETDPGVIEENLSEPHFWGREADGGTAAYRRTVAHPRYPNARLDTVIHRADHRVDYLYTQELPANENTDKLRLYLSGGIRNSRGRQHDLKSSDTLLFSVKSMLSFLDERTRYRQRIVLRDAEANARFYFTFPKGRHKLSDTEENRRQIRAVRDLTRRLMTDPIFIIDSITLQATSSPEGSWKVNERLACARAEALQSVLVEEFSQLYDSLRIGAAVTLDGASQEVVADSDEQLPDLPHLLRSTWLAEDWDELARLVARDEQLDDKEALLALINDRSIGADRREARLRARYPQAYLYMREKIYPQMRAVDFRFNLHRRGQKQDTVYTDEVDVDYMAAVDLMKKRRYEEALEILRPYEDLNTGLAYLSLGYNEAAERVLQAQPNASQRPEIQYMLSILSARRGDEQQAVVRFLQACELDKALRSRGNLDPELSYLIRKYGLDKEDFDSGR